MVIFTQREHQWPRVKMTNYQAGRKVSEETKPATLMFNFQLQDCERINCLNHPVSGTLFRQSEKTNTYHK
jgi:hypothetical protein